MASLLRTLYLLVVYAVGVYMGYRIGVRDGKEKLLKLFERIAATEDDDEQST